MKPFFFVVNFRRPFWCLIWISMSLCARAHGAPNLWWWLTSILKPITAWKSFCSLKSVIFMTWTSVDVTAKSIKADGNKCTPIFHDMSRSDALICKILLSKKARAFFKMSKISSPGDVLFILVNEIPVKSDVPSSLQVGHTDYYHFPVGSW